MNYEFSDSKSRMDMLEPLNMVTLVIIMGLMMQNTLKSGHFSAILISTSSSKMQFRPILCHFSYFMSKWINSDGVFNLKDVRYDN